MNRIDEAIKDSHAAVDRVTTNYTELAKTAVGQGKRLGEFLVELPEQTPVKDLQIAAQAYYAAMGDCIGGAGSEPDSERRTR